jgi:hypothetical protein
MLPAKDGRAQAVFDLSDNITTFRIFVFGHSPDGRLGWSEGKLVSGPTLPQGQKAAPAK